MSFRDLLVGCIAGCCALTATADDLSPSGDYEGRAIGEVRFEPPLQPVSREELARLVPLSAGKPLKLDEVRDSIKRLYATGEYQDVEVSWESGANGLILIFRTTEQWFVGPVEVRGKISHPPNEGQLANATRLELGQPFSDEDIAAAAKGIQDLMQRNGLYPDKIQSNVQRDEEHQQVALTFNVESGSRARLEAPDVTGDTRLSKEDLGKAAKYKGWFRWKPATAQNTQSGVQGVRKKYNKDNRLTASVLVEKTEYDASGNRVKPTLRADGGPKVSVKTEGAKVSKGNLHKYVPVFDEETINRDLLVRGVANLRDYFQNKGYFDVGVDFQTKQVDADHEEITYIVGLGQRRKLVKVSITGNHYFNTEQIRERMFLEEAGFIRLRHGRYSDGFLQRDQRAIEALYKDNGFRDVRVTPETGDARGKPGAVAVTFRIDEGLQYQVAKLDVTGIHRPDRDQILARLASSAGQPYTETAVALDRDSILNVYQSSGYPEASFDWRMTTDAANHQVSLTYIVVEGPPRYVREVLITGLHTTRQRLIQPRIRLKPGDPLSWTAMADMQRRLYNLGIFDKVDMAIQNPDGDTSSKYVLYHLTEGHRYYVALGAGAEVARIGGSDTSLDQPAGATGFAPRGSFDISRLNLWGLGHSLNFKSRYSTLDRRVSLNYSAPRYRNVEGSNLSFTALYDNTRDVRTFTAARYEASVQLSQRFSKATTALWRYSWRDVRVDESTLKINPVLIPLLSQPARIGMLSGSIIQDRRDNPTDAHRGIYNTLDLGLAYHYFGGDKNFLRFLARSSWYHQLTPPLVLASNTEFGVIRPFHITPGVTSAEYIPLPERFFGGGSTSQRGFADQQAGPRDLTTGFALGGNALLFHSTELRFPLIGDNIQGVLFHDMGNVYSNLSKISFRYHQSGLDDFNYMVHAIGFGIRYRTPVGPLRLDLAYSLNPPTFNGLKGTYQDLIQGTATPAIQKGKHFQFFINIGQAF